MKDCQFGVSPVNYSDSDSEHSLLPALELTLYIRRKLDTYIPFDAGLRLQVGSGDMLGLSTLLKVCLVA